MRNHRLGALGASLFVAAAMHGCGEPESGPIFHGCTDANFVDRTAATAERRVGFGSTRGSGPFDYLPKCILIAAGQSVSFEGDFNQHPLSPGTSATARNAGSPNNPITRTTSGSSASFTFASAGTYPYFCELHVAAGMAGVVRVR